MFSYLLTILFTLFILAGVPILSVWTARRCQLYQLPRRSLYFSAVLSQWVLACVGFLVFILALRRLLPVFFSTLPLDTLASWSLAPTVVALVVLGAGLLLEHQGWWPVESELVYMLIPETRAEKLWSLLLVAPTAALCEEFLYRGYLLAQIGQWFHSAYWGWGVSSAAFGLAHAYQGWGGVLRAALLGAVLAYPVVRLGSLYPSMLAHGLIDALALVWLGPMLLRKKQST
jgi:membrane protease YdiL (CAAX protease family)